MVCIYKFILFQIHHYLINLFIFLYSENERSLLNLRIEAFALGVFKDRLKIAQQGLEHVIQSLLQEKKLPLL